MKPSEKLCGGRKQLAGRDTISTRARHKIPKNDGNSCKSELGYDLRRRTISRSVDKRRQRWGNDLLIRRFRVRFPGDPPLPARSGPFTEHFCNSLWSCVYLAPKANDQGVVVPTCLRLNICNRSPEVDLTSSGLLAAPIVEKESYRQTCLRERQTRRKAGTQSHGAQSGLAGIPNDMEKTDE